MKAPIFIENETRRVAELGYETNRMKMSIQAIPFPTDGFSIVEVTGDAGFTNKAVADVIAAERIIEELGLQVDRFALARIIGLHQTIAYEEFTKKGKYIFQGLIDKPKGKKKSARDTQNKTKSTPDPMQAAMENEIDTIKSLPDVPTSKVATVQPKVEISQDTPSAVETSGPQLSSNGDRVTQQIEEPMGRTDLISRTHKIILPPPKHKDSLKPEQKNKARARPPQPPARKGNLGKRRDGRRLGS